MKRSRKERRRTDTKKRRRVSRIDERRKGEKR